jgi:hypothetical protein
MNAFEAAEKNGRAADLQKELEDLFKSQNKSKDATSIPATFLRVTVALLNGLDALVQWSSSVIGTIVLIVLVRGCAY